MLLQYAAVEIYCDRAAAVDRTFELRAANAPAIAELCRELEGLPLAIELAAAHAKTLSAAEVVRHLDGARLDVVRRRHDGAPERHDDLRAAISWTYDVLAPDEQRLLRVLSRLSGTFDLDAIVHLSGAPFVDALDRLETLVDFHLVDPVPMSEPARFQMASSVRSFGRERLEAHGELESATRAHIAYRAGQARAGAAGIASRSEVLWFQTLSADHDDLVGSLKTTLDAGLTDDAIDLVVGLAPVWSMRGYYGAQEELVESAIRLGAEHNVETVAFANALLWSAFLGLEWGATVDPAELVTRLQHGEALARRAQDDATLLRALAYWLLVAPFTGDVARAQAASTEGLALAQRTGDERWLGQIEAWSGMLATLLGDEARAVQLGRDALARARRRGDDRTLVLATMLLMPLRRNHPEVATEMPSTEDALAAARRTGLRMYEALLLPMMVGDATAAGDVPTALRWAGESLVVARSMVGSAIVGYNRMIMVSLMARCDADATAAYFHGTVRDEIPALSRTMSPKQVAVYEAAVAQTKMRLGDSRFEAEAGHGARRTAPEALDDAIAAVQETSQRLGTSVPAAGVESTEAPDEGLTRRQREVLDLLVEGLSNKEIAARLDVSPKTVMHHTMAIYRALGVRGRAEAAVVAIRLQTEARGRTGRSDAPQS